MVTDMEANVMDERLCIIAEAISSAGYDLREQLTGYLLSGNEAYITRRNHARELTSTVDKGQLQSFVDSLAGNL